MKANKKLSDGQKRVLKRMRDDSLQLVHLGRSCWLGDSQVYGDRVTRDMFDRLMFAGLIEWESDHRDFSEYHRPVVINFWRISDKGRQALERSA
jgi:hypothetical protein